MTSADSSTGIKSTSFGYWLKERRNALNLTQEELSSRVGCSPETIRKIEAGVRRPSKQIAEILADLLHIPVEERDAFISFSRGEGSTPGLGQVAEARAQPGAAAPRRHNTLPTPLTPLIGRQHEVEQVCGLLLSDRVRLLTLMGTGGIGKTRLALEVAARLASLPSFAGRGSRQLFKDGVFFVPLAPITEPDLLFASIAQTIGLQEAGPKSLFEVLVQFAHDRSMLLVLDNFEQIIPAGPQIAQLLAMCPQLKVLVTSRELLHLYGERQYSVPPLALPDVMRKIENVAALQDYPSIALFVESAQAVRPGFALTEQNAQDVAMVCAHLGGLPLAIELAAARTKLLTPQAMLATLAGSLDSLNLLTGGGRDLPPRHQTLRAAIQWSYNLLDEDEKRLFRRLGVFVGGCTLVAAESVCNSKGDIEGSVAAVLESLLDKSLLHYREETTGQWVEGRFYLLEMLREYSLERLAEEGAGEADSTRRLHKEYYLAMTGMADLEWKGPHRVEWLDRLESERHNLRNVLHWLRESGELVTALRMVGALRTFWFQRGYIREGLDECLAVLAVSEGIDTVERVRALYSAGQLAMMHDDFAGERRLYEQSLEVARKLGNDAESKKALADALRGLSIVVTRDDKDFELAREYAEEQLTIYSDLGDKYGNSIALFDMGGVNLHQGNYVLARRYYDEGLAMALSIEARSILGPTYVNLGEVARGQGDYAGARSYYESGLAVFRERSSKTGEAMVLYNLGHVARQEGKYDQAVTHLVDSLDLYQQMGKNSGVARALAGIATVWGAQGYAERAARLAGAAEALMYAVGYELVDIDRDEHERGLETMRAALGEGAFEAAHKLGSTMTLEQALVYALGDGSANVG